MHIDFAASICREVKFTTDIVKGFSFIIVAFFLRPRMLSFYADFSCIMRHPLYGKLKSAFLHLRKILY
jgi:hypothetical protein